MTLLLKVPCFLIVVSTVQVGSVLGQEVGGGSSPQRVRVTAPGFTADPVVGDLVAIDDDTITVVKSGTNKILVPIHAVTRFEVRRRPGRKLMGLGIGLLGGAAIGALLGEASDDCTSGADPLSEGFCEGLEDLATPAYAVLGGLIGAGVGFLVAPGEQWEAVNHENVRISIRPHIGRHGTVAMFMTLRF
jgi:hypothetical protein